MRAGSDIAGIAARGVAICKSRRARRLRPPAILPGKWKDHKFVKAVAPRTCSARGAQGVVTVGTRQPGEGARDRGGHQRGHQVGGVVVRYAKATLLDTKSGPGSLAEIVDAANKGLIDTLVITAWNPVYTAPKDIPFAEALKKIPERHRLFARSSKTRQLPYARWYLHVCARARKSWGDSANADGVIAIQQPLIAPLWNGTQRAELFAAFAGKADLGAYQLLKEVCATRRARRRLATSVQPRLRSVVGAHGAEGPSIVPAREPFLVAGEVA